MTVQQQCNKAVNILKDGLSLKTQTNKKGMYASYEWIGCEYTETTDMKEKRNCHPFIKEMQQTTKNMSP